MKNRKPVKVEEKSVERKNDAARITARGAFSDILKSVGGFVASPIRTALSLIRRPGEVCREYIFGDRDRVLNPAAFAAWAATIYLAVNYAVQSDIGRFLDPFAGFRGAWPYIGMLLLAPVAALQKRLFRKHGLNWAETFSFGLYMLGQVALVHTAVNALQYFTAIDFNQLLLLVPESLYVAWAATGLYKDRHWTVWLRAWLAFATYCALGYGLLLAYQWYRFAGLFG